MSKYALVCALVISSNAIAFDDEYEHRLVTLQNQFCGQFVDHPVTVAKLKALGIPAVQLHSTITEKWYTQLKQAKTEARKEMANSMVAMQRRVVDQTFAGQPIATVREEMMTSCYSISRTYADHSWAKK